MESQPFSTLLRLGDGRRGAFRQQREERRKGAAEGLELRAECTDMTHRTGLAGLLRIGRYRGRLLRREQDKRGRNGKRELNDTTNPCGRTIIHGESPIVRIARSEFLARDPRGFAGKKIASNVFIESHEVRR